MAVRVSGRAGAGDPMFATSVWVALAVVLALPVFGLVFLLAEPDADGHWDHHPSHFWLVLGTAAVAAGLGWAVGTAGRRRNDARLFLTSLAFVSAAAFLGLHALATPQVLLSESTVGFAVATPVGLVVASVFACWSALPLDGDRARWVMTRTTLLRAVVIGLAVVWAIWSLGSFPPLDNPSTPDPKSAFMLSLAVPSVILYGFAAWRYVQLAMRRQSVLLIAVSASWVLLADGRCGDHDQVEGVVVGVARAHARCVRSDRVGREPPARGRALQRPVPRRSRRRDA